MDFALFIKVANRTVRFIFLLIPKHLIFDKW